MKILRYFRFQLLHWFWIYGKHFNYKIKHSYSLPEERLDSLLEIYFLGVCSCFKCFRLKPQLKMWTNYAFWKYMYLCILSYIHAHTLSSGIACFLCELKPPPSMPSDDVNIACTCFSVDFCMIDSDAILFLFLWK